MSLPGMTKLTLLARSFYPQYNIGVRLPLGTFVQTPLSARAANSQVLISEFDVNTKKLEVRAKCSACCRKIEGKI